MQLWNKEFRRLLQNNSIYKILIYLVTLSQDRQIAVTHNSSNKYNNKKNVT